jgi:hypothetical protein
MGIPTPDQRPNSPSNFCASDKDAMALKERASTDDVPTISASPVF